MKMIKDVLAQTRNNEQIKLLSKPLKVFRMRNLLYCEYGSGEV